MQVTYVDLEFPQVSVKVRKVICSVTAPLPRPTRVDPGGFVTGLCMYVCTYYTILRIE